eukprot:g20808.t1
MACPQFKVVVLGDFMAGKTSLVNRFTRASFDPDILNTVGLDFQVKKVRASQDPVKLELWDTAGDPRFRSLIPTLGRKLEGKHIRLYNTRQYVSEADALLVVYDITNLESFATARRWVLDLEDLAPSALLALVGTKVDRGSARAVSKEEAQIFSEAKKMIFAETSAKTGENVDALFEELSELLPGHLRPAPRRMEEPSQNSERRRCCFFHMAVAMWTSLSQAIWSQLWDFLWSHELIQAAYASSAVLASLRGADQAVLCLPNLSSNILRHPPGWQKLNLQAVRRAQLPRRGQVDLRPLPLQTALCWDAPATLADTEVEDLEEEEAEEGPPESEALTFELVADSLHRVLRHDFSSGPQWGCSDFGDLPPTGGAPAAAAAPRVRLQVRLLEAPSRFQLLRPSCDRAVWRMDDWRGKQAFGPAAYVSESMGMESCPSLKLLLGLGPDASRDLVKPQTFALHRPLPVLHRTGVFHFRDVAAEPLALFASAAPNVSLRFALQVGERRRIFFHHFSLMVGPRCVVKMTPA